MGGAPYIGPRLGDGPIFVVSVSHLDVKERPGKFTHAIFIILIVAATIDFGLIHVSTITTQERGWLAIGPILHRMPLTAAILSGRGYDR